MSQKKDMQNLLKYLGKLLLRIVYKPECAICIIIEDTKLLVSERHSHVDFYPNGIQVPGGKLKFLEPPEAGALRELYEETQLKGEIESKFGVLEPENPKFFGRVHIFIVRIPSGCRPSFFESEKNSAWDFVEISSLKEKEDRLTPALKKYLQRSWFNH